MNLSEYQNIFLHEDTHFYYKTNHKIILSLIEKYIKRKNKLKILDAGCGAGLFGVKLQNYGKVIGIDASREALFFAKKRGFQIKKASIDKLPFKNNSFDLLTCIDVINHNKVRSDKKSIKEFYRVLKPEGLLILRVSANPWLHLIHDKHVHIKFRYSKANLRQKLLQAGFEIKKLSYVNMVLLPLAIIKMIYEKMHVKKQTASGISEVPTFLNIMLTSILSSESHILPYLNLPFGIGLVAVSRKP